MTPVEWRLSCPDGSFNVSNVIPDALRLNGVVAPILPVTIQDGVLVAKFPRGPAMASIEGPVPDGEQPLVLNGVLTDSLKLEGSGLVHVLGPAEVPDRAGSKEAFQLSFPKGNVTGGWIDLGLTIPGRGHVEVNVIDVSGRLVRRLIDEILDKGYHVVRWDGHSSVGRRVSSGVYFVQARLDGKERTIHLLIVR